MKISKCTDLASLRRFAGATVLGLACLGVLFASFGNAPAKAQSRFEDVSAASAAAIYATTYDYVANFYPLWFTNKQWQYSSDNRFAGPKQVTPSRMARNSKGPDGAPMS